MATNTSTGAEQRQAPDPSGDRAPVRSAARDERCATTPIHFAFRRSMLGPDARALLEPLAHCLHAHPTARLRLTGHADVRGQPEYNRALATWRAESAARFLRNRGAEAEQLSLESEGADRPVCSQDVEACHRKNRRVDPAWIVSP